MVSENLEILQVERADTTAFFLKGDFEDLSPEEQESWKGKKTLAKNSQEPLVLIEIRLFWKRTR